MKYSGHRKLLCELSKLLKFNAFKLLGYKTNTKTLILVYKFRPGRTGFNMYATAINFLCITFLLKSRNLPGTPFPRAVCTAMSGGTKLIIVLFLWSKHFCRFQFAKFEVKQKFKKIFLFKNVSIYNKIFSNSIVLIQKFIHLYIRNSKQLYLCNKSSYD